MRESILKYYKNEYDYKEVYDSTLSYFHGDDVATNVWVTKYCLSEVDDNGFTHYFEKTPDDTFHRIASEIYIAGLKYKNPLSEEEIYNLIKDFKYILFQGRPMAGIGSKVPVSISNCFVVGEPNSDSYGTIAYIDQLIMQISKRGGGCVWENTKVVSKKNGIIPIKDIEIGDEILSFNITTREDEWKEVMNKYDTDVALSDQIELVYSNGARLKTSKKHPILHFADNTYSYKSVNDGYGVGDLNKTITIKDEASSIVKTLEINPDIAQKLRYIDIEVKDNNNYYAGEFGFVNIHNCGTDISNYRPSGAKVNNAATTSTGPVDICANRFSNTIREVGMRGRRGALLLSMDINHPDSEKFIDAKMEDGKITGANISVKINDEWMKSALGIGREIDNEKNRLWKKIIHNATTKAEPGVLFWDTIIRESVADCYKDYGFETLTTNPCQPGWAPILTPNGLSSFERIKIGDTIWSSEGWTKVINKFHTGKKMVKEYRTSGGIFWGTENHRVVSNGVKVEAKDAKSIDILCGDKEYRIDVNSEKYKIGTVDGLVIGNGSIHNGNDGVIYINIKEEDHDYFSSNIHELIGQNIIEISPYAYIVNTKTRFEELPKESLRHIPYEYIYTDDKNAICGFLRGLYSANGNINNGDIILNSSSKALIDSAQLMLSLVGIRSYSNVIDEEEHLNADSKSYTLVINSDKDIFYENIGFLQKYKMDELGKDLSSKNTLKTCDILSVKDIEVEDVYDITVDNASHTYWTSGVNVSNCGEITLSNCDSCRLMALNLYSYVENPFTDSAYFNYDLFAKHARLTVKLMDNMIDLEAEKIQQIIDKVESDPERDEIKAIELNLWKRIKEVCLLGRRSGIGITGEGDMLAAMGYRYGTPEATEFAANIQQILALNAYIGSCDLVQKDERPSFGCFNYQLEKNNPFLRRLSDENNAVYNHEITKRFIEEFKEKWANGRRNIALLTIAPTGSLSCETQTTSGIEPVFMIKYTRRRKIDKDSGIKPDFIDKTGDYFINFNVLHNKFIVWYSVYKNIPFDEAKKELEVMSDDEFDVIFEKSPYYKATAMDCDWKEKVHMQGEMQKNVDHSISCCLEPDTLIDTEDGMKYLDELYDFNALKEEEFGYADTNVKVKNRFGEYVSIKSYYNNGVKDVYKITLENGLSVNCTNNERFLIYDNGYKDFVWKELKDIHEGNIIKLLSFGETSAFDDNIFLNKNSIDSETAKKIASGEIRVPIEYRKDKKSCMELINTLTNMGVDKELCCAQLKCLFKWASDYCGNVSDVKSIEYVGKKQTYDIETDGTHSFIANGIIVHNTVNLPKGTTEGLVEELYRTAWESGCKGCTIYVDGSRDGVLVNNKKDNCGCKDFLEKDAPKRPKSLPCKIIRFVNKGEKWIAAVGLYEGRPYEIFTGLLEKLNIPNNIDDGFIVRNKIDKLVCDEETGIVENKLVSRYDLTYTDSDGATKSIEGLSTVFNKEFWNYGKLVSGLLRHGMPIQYVIKVISSLDFKDDGINSWKNGVIRALKRFARDGETEEICPECGAKLWRESGCVICKSCGWSKCG